MKKTFKSLCYQQRSTEHRFTYTKNDEEDLKSTRRIKSNTLLDLGFLTNGACAARHWRYAPDLGIGACFCESLRASPLVSTESFLEAASDPLLSVPLDPQEPSPLACKLQFSPWLIPPLDAIRDQRTTPNSARQLTIFPVSSMCRQLQFTFDRRRIRGGVPSHGQPA